MADSIIPAKWTREHVAELRRDLKRRFPIPPEQLRDWAGYSRITMLSLLDALDSALAQQQEPGNA